MYFYVRREQDFTAQLYRKEKDEERESRRYLQNYY